MMSLQQVILAGFTEKLHKNENKELSSDRKIGSQLAAFKRHSSVPCQC